jgi:hypothetical protein
MIISGSINLARSYECSKGRSASMKGEQIIGKLSKCQLMKEDWAPWTQE